MLTFSEIQQFKQKLSGLWAPGNERCGIFTPGHEVEEKPNRSKTPLNTFTFDYEDLDGAIATWHTHPSGEATLSPADYWFFKSWPSHAHFIISSTEVRCYIVFQEVVYLVDEEEDHPAWSPS